MFEQQAGEQKQQTMHTPPPVKGYRALTDDEVALMNAIKESGEVFDRLFAAVGQHLENQRLAALNLGNTPEAHAELARIKAAEPMRWIAIARTDFQTGLMALTRAVAQPSTF